MDRGIGSWVTRHAHANPQRVALAEGTAELTWAGFEVRTNRLAHALVDLGVRRGDRVAVLLVNSIAFMEATFAIAKLGAIMVPVNTRLTAPEVGYILADSGTDVLIAHDVLGAVAAGALHEPGVRVRHHVVVRAWWAAPGAVPHRADAGATVHQVDVEEAVEAGGVRPLGMDVDPRDVHGIMYTSGTTGRPKGAMLTHANALANARNNLILGRGLRATDVTITVAPMFHIGGLGVHSLPLVYVGGTNVVQPAFVPDQLLAAIEARRATVQFLVPAMWAAVARCPDLDRYDLSSLELALSGGAPCPLPIIEAFSNRGISFQEGFGMTETAPSVSVLDAEHVKSKAGSIGRALPDVEARLVDDNDRTVPVGAVGELVVRGDNITPGYWMQPEATAEAWRGGWFHTGDLGRIDDEGYITLVDRKKDMIISGGENVYPIEVEQVLFRYPGVREAAIFGVPDERWGETVVAAVAWEAGPDAGPGDPAAVIDWCRQRLAHFKCPTRVVVVDELPRNATGKVLKTVLRQSYGGTGSPVSR
jgi:acyl-CoA synthetase (AMP-forming)/AMP-acid ligase II